MDSALGTVQKLIEKSSPRSLRFMNDYIAAEEPLELRIDAMSEDGHRRAHSLSITMRTPGHDHEWAAGFLFSEGIITSSQQIKRIAHCGPAIKRWDHSNVIKVELVDEHVVDSSAAQRNFYMTSSCGVCGKSSLEALRVKMPFTPLDTDGPVVSRDLISSLPDRLRQSQAAFALTGGLHASALFTANGTFLISREDVGRHNALDKVLGHALMNHQLPLSSGILVLSGRISFELVQKAAMAGIRFIVAVGAPSSLAIESAQDQKMTLVGFVRNDQFNIYSESWRVK